MARKNSYWLARFLFLRLLGLIYSTAFLVLIKQFRPLIGTDGIFPVSLYLQHVGAPIPTLFWLSASDAALAVVAWVGLALSLLLLFGFANAVQLALLWALYLSVVSVGQLFYGYGWETLLLETGFLAIFLSPPVRGHPFPTWMAPPHVIIWLLRWVLFRLMFGAALIKLRGDPCWRDLTCLDYHFETQPLPNPLSWYFHHLPKIVLKGGVLFNHFAELIAPWMIFGPRRIRHIGGMTMLLFQAMLILSGNLSWLNWLTIALCMACFDDTLLRRFFPGSLRLHLEAIREGSRASRLQRGILAVLTSVIILLSIAPVLNLLSPGQAMNRSFEPFHLVNTYGAFGSVTKVRREVIIEGTDEATITPATRWREYEFKCKPGDIARRPCLISPYQHRLDWQIWFAAMSDHRRHPWLIPFASKLLNNDPGILGLLEGNPFPDRPPTFVRAELYEYHFTDRHDPTDAWWVKIRVGPYFPPLSLKD